CSQTEFGNKMLEQDAGTRCWNKMLEQDAGTRCWNKMLEQDAGTRCKEACVRERVNCHAARFGRLLIANKPNISSSVMPNLAGGPFCSSTSWNSWRLRSNTSAMRFSIVSCDTKRVTITGSFCPMRWARLMAWSSTAGFHQRSNRN